MSCICNKLNETCWVEVKSSNNGTVSLLKYGNGIAINFEYEMADQDVFIEHCPFCGRKFES